MVYFRCFSSVVESSLILEDLNEIGFKNIARRDGLSIRQLQNSLEKLAKWHAATAKVFQANDKENDLFLIPHVRIDGSKFYRVMFENALSNCCDIFNGNELIEKLMPIKSKIFEKCCDAVRRNENDFNVLTHGDLWSNNILFNQNDEPLFVSIHSFSVNKERKLEKFLHSEKEREFYNIFL